MRKNNRGAVYEQMQEEPQSCLRRDFPLSDATFVAAFSNFIVTPPYPRDCLHYHNCMELGVCLSGSGTIVFNGGYIDCSGDMYSTYIFSDITLF